MTVRALILDIDGTLLNSCGVMTEPTYQALRSCADKGLLLCVATTRAGRLVFRKREIPWDHDFLLERGIYYGGGTVRDTPCDFYQHTPVPGPLVAELTRAIEECDGSLQIALQHDDEYHAFKQSMPDPDLASWEFSRDELLDFAVARDKPTTKMIVYHGTDLNRRRRDVAELHRRLTERFQARASILLADSKASVYILSRHVSKGAAIRQLIALNGIKPEEVAVFGDDTPDAGMFGMFGHSIAMGNADKSLKEHATFVTRTNDEDGVVYALREHLKVL